MIYLDNASTTYPKPPAVAQAMARFLNDLGVTPGRGAGKRAVQAERMVADVRRRLAAMIGGRDPDRIIFTASCTDALNMAIKGLLREGDHVVTTMLEHNSVNRPLEALRQAGAITLTRVPFDADGVIDPDEIAKAMTPTTRFVALNHASNVTGVIQPAQAVGRLARERDAVFLLDAAQSIGLVDIDVEKMCCDLLAFPAHKELLGPPGVGGLYVGDRAKLRPWREGGTGTDSASTLQPGEMPFALEAGTPNTVGIAGLAAALDELAPARALAQVRSLLGRLVDGLSGDERFRIYANPDPACRVGTMSLSIKNVTPEDAAAILDDSFDIAVRGGLQCAPFAHRQLGTFPEGTIRISPGPYTTVDDIDQTCSALKEIAAG